MIIRGDYVHYKYTDMFLNKKNSLYNILQLAIKQANNFQSTLQRYIYN